MARSASRPAPSASPLEEKAAAVTQRLREEYGRHAPSSDGHPTDSLLATILSQHTADRNSHAAYARLKQRYSSWEEIAYAEPSELEDTIRCAGLARGKAMHIQGALRTAEARFGTMDLSFIRDLPLHEARQILRSLPGVGPKTAGCVLLFSCDLPALPVDTHVYRVAGRLGLIGPRASVGAAHDLLEALVPSSDVYDFHVNLIAHGRQVCKARAPECGRCVLQDLCDYFQAARSPIAAEPGGAGYEAPAVRTWSCNRAAAETP